MDERELATARTAFQAWNDGNVESLARCFHPDCEVLGALALGEPYRGHAGLRQW